jgi:glycosyltransferase involved in cell wall biosynthesis
VLLVLGTSGGGVGRHVRDLASSLVAAGHEVVIAGPQSTQDALDLTASGARFVVVPIAERPSVTGDPRSLRTLRSLARDADVIHAHGLRAGALAGLARGRSGPPPLVVTLHNALVAGGAIAAAYAGLERVVARRADAVLCVSPDLERRQRELGAREVAAAVIAAPRPAALRRPPEQTRELLGASPGDVVAVSVARLAEQKGLPLLLDAAGRLKDGQRPLRIIVAGDGPAKSALQQRISREQLPVELLGWRDDIPDLLAAADIAVSSAVWEGQPIWLQEALLAGRPIVATDVGGTRHVVGRAAVLVPAGAATELAAAIDRLAGDPTARARLSEAALIRATELPDPAAARDAALAVYDRLLSTDAGDC